MKKTLMLAIVIAACFIHVFAQTSPPSTADKTSVFDPAKVEIMVVGSFHLQQVNADEIAVSGNLIARSLAKYKPDHIVVEWLNPAINPATTFNYRSLGDLETLARLWGYQMPKAADALTAAKKLLDEQKRAQQTQFIPRTRIELAKLYYLNRDLLNASYQCWRAQQSGIDVQDLQRLMLNFMRGHEIEVFGFEIARSQGLEYITPFDYQGDDVGSEVWGELMEQLGVFAIEKKHGVKESDPRWKDLTEAFGKDREAFEQKRDKALGEKYGDIKEVREYMAAFEWFDQVNTLMPKSRDGVSQMRHLQSPQYLAAERKNHFEIISNISLNGLGAKRTAGNIRRNERMADFTEADIKRLGTKRVMIVVGSAHKFFLEDILKKRGYKIVQSADFMP